LLFQSQEDENEKICVKALSTFHSRKTDSGKPYSVCADKSPKASVKMDLESMQIEPEAETQDATLRLGPATKLQNNTVTRQETQLQVDFKIHRGEREAKEREKSRHTQTDDQTLQK
jgi:hypothetical protein